MEKNAFAEFGDNVDLGLSPHYLSASYIWANCGWCNSRMCANIPTWYVRKIMRTRRMHVLRDTHVLSAWYNWTYIQKKTRDCLSSSNLECCPEIMGDPILLRPVEPDETCAVPLCKTRSHGMTTMPADYIAVVQSSYEGTNVILMMTIDTGEICILGCI